MLLDMTGRQLMEWRFFYNMEPWGFDVEDTHVGMVAATVMRSQGADVQPRDYMMSTHMPDRKEPEPEPEDIVTQLKRLLPPAPAVTPKPVR